jgi:tetratricopeptide (TPR) repeat protein
MNKLILIATTHIKKNQYPKAYEMLKLPIQQGVNHSDIFYLYGDVCRILKKPEEAEKFLLECLRFEYHSPFVFYSLGILYLELEQFPYSISLFKHFLKIMVNTINTRKQLMHILI